MRTAMTNRVQYYISAVRKRGEHITHCRVHKALRDGSFAPYGLVQPRSTVIMNLRSNSSGYKTLQHEANRLKPGDRVSLVEVDRKFYLRKDEGEEPGDDLGNLPSF